MLIGPIFGSGTLPWLFVLFGIPLALIVISMVHMHLYIALIAKPNDMFSDYFKTLF